jgi:hypothetical protein
MQPTSVKTVNGKKTWSQEIWVMYKVEKTKPKTEKKSELDNYFKMFKPQAKLKVITAWRYPGVSPKRDPVPQEIIDEARAALF